MSKWYLEKGPESDVAISSRVRLARNLEKYTFPSRISDEEAVKLVDEIKTLVLSSDKFKGYNFSYFNMQLIDPLNRQVLVEKHLISPDLSRGNKPSAALISRDEKISMMVNEEDHLRIQCLFSGMQIDNAVKLGKIVDDKLDSLVEYAFDKEFGYLTCCPTNLGTGIRISIMMHLPGLAMSGYLNSIFEACSKLGVAVRGMYGEHTEAQGNLFQFSNQVTLGQSDEEIAKNIKNIAAQIIEQERRLREQLYSQNKYMMEDKIFRSLGVIQNARIISSDESLKLLSYVRMGVDMGIIKTVSTETLNEIMLITRPACLQKIIGRELSPEERDIERANLIKSRLNTNSGEH